MKKYCWEEQFSAPNLKTQEAKEIPLPLFLFTQQVFLNPCSLLCLLLSSRNSKAEPLPSWYDVSDWEAWMEIITIQGANQAVYKDCESTGAKQSVLFIGVMKTILSLKK